MNFNPNPRQAFVLLHLLITDDTPMQSKPPLSTFTAKDRNELVTVGLIALEQQGRAKHLVLTDKAWDWARNHLNASIPKTQQAAPLLHKLLATLQLYLQENDIPLAELLTMRAQSRPSPVSTNGAQQEPATDDLPERITDAYLAASRGQLHVDVRLAALRKQLNDVSREQVDQTLLQMQRDGALTLMRLDDPQSIAPEDLVAALDIHGDKRHILYMKG